jgi:hypothetical protein
MWLSTSNIYVLSAVGWWPCLWKDCATKLQSHCGSTEATRARQLWVGVPVATEQRGGSGQALVSARSGLGSFCYSHQDETVVPSDLCLLAMV